jgi:tRNA-specific 2-thiouridylase
MSSKPIVAVAMSGGVDSSVAAALLVDGGYSVIGMMLRLWSEQDAERSNRCCTPDSIASARRIASILSIPFYVLDARQLFYDSVVQPFITDYAHNRTPNPCIACNRLVRWGFLFNYARSAGADFLATGHYARLNKFPDQPIQLLRGLDSSKDQSYVLHVLTQEQLAHAMFPVGEYNKTEVRQLAQRFNLPVADRPDSQDLCFIGGDGDYRQFLLRHAPEVNKPGNIFSPLGHLLGKHQGLAFYTIGQRKGLHLSSTSPLYVHEKNLESNTLIVGNREESRQDQFLAEQVNWIAGEPPSSTFRAQIKIRYKAHDMPASVEVMPGDQIKLKLDQPAYDLTPGQAAVLYNGDICLGGGIISNTLE